MFFWNSLSFSMIQRMLAIWSLVPLPFLNQLEHLEVHGSCIAEAWLGEFGALLSLLVCEMSAAFLFLKYFYYFRITIIYHCIGFYSFELLSYTQIHWPLQYCCKVGVKSRTWFYPITNSCVNLLSFTDAGRKQQTLGSESKECITYGTTIVMHISIFVLLSFCS